MNREFNRPFQHSRIVIRETDDYMGSGHNAPAPGPDNPWIRNLFQPLTFTILVACVLWPLAQILAGVSPLLNQVHLRLIPTAMALVGFTTQRMAGKRLLSGTEAMRFRLIELGVLLLLVKIAGLLDSTPAELISLARTWSQTPLSFFDAGTLVTFMLGTMTWWSGSATARDLEAVRDPALYIGETEPRRRLANRYFLGGALLMIAAAISRVDMLRVITLAQERIRKPIGSALLYFLLGLVMLGQIRYAHLTSLWQRDRVTISKDLNVKWLRYLLTFLALIAAIAFILPTGYTLGFMELITFIITLIISLIMILYMLIAWPFALLASLFMGESEPVPPPTMDRLPIEPEMLMSTDGGANPWWALIRSALFWVVLIGAVVYLVRSYIRDRPELRRLVQNITPLRWAAGLWHALRRWFRSLGTTAARLLPEIAARIRQARADRELKRTQPSASGLREQLLQHYLRTLDTAQEAGIPRRQAETPYEYRVNLQAHVEEEQEALTDLTEAFIEARYSSHPVSPENVAAQKSNAQRIRRSLRERPED